jgi:hypothetical protein
MIYYILYMEYRGLLYGRQICRVTVIFKHMNYISVEPFMYMVVLEENCELQVSLNSNAISYKGF